VCRRVATHPRGGGRVRPKKSPSSHSGKPPPARLAGGAGFPSECSLEPVPRPPTVNPCGSDTIRLRRSVFLRAIECPESLAADASGHSRGAGTDTRAARSDTQPSGGRLSPGAIGVNARRAGTWLAPVPALQWRRRGWDRRDSWRLQIITLKQLVPLVFFAACRTLPVFRTVSEQPAFIAQTLFRTGHARLDRGAVAHGSSRSRSLRRLAKAR
jgi:hypothetical protein